MRHESWTGRSGTEHHRTAPGTRFHRTASTWTLAPWGGARGFAQDGKGEMILLDCMMVQRTSMMEVRAMTYGSKIHMP